MDYPRRWNNLGLSLAALLVFAALLPALAIAPVAAQDDERVPHPAHIHSGSCDDLGDIVVPLADVQENRAGERFGAQTAIAVEQSFTEAPMQLGEILAAPHAINIHLSADEIQNYIACGDIGGRVIDNRLAIGLRELNDSGFSGVAVLAGTDAGTDVTLYLAWEGGGEADAAADDAAAPAADAGADDATAAAEADTAGAETPAAADEAPAAVEVAVDIRDFAYNPASVEIAVGDSVTWTNQDTVPHTATASDAAVLQSGTIAPGASFSQVFEAPGEIEYHCEFHPNMVGTIVVS
jgi:plastocyanin